MKDIFILKNFPLGNFKWEKTSEKWGVTFCVIVFGIQEKKKPQLGRSTTDFL